MFRSKADRERERYYLLPGMGEHAARRKHKYYLQWAIVTGLGVAAMVAVLIYWLNRLDLF